MPLLVWMHVIFGDTVIPGIGLQVQLQITSKHCMRMSGICWLITTAAWDVCAICYFLHLQ
jgi:hypothetical protein